MAGGPSVNIAIAFVIFGGLFATYGNIGDPVTEPKVAEVQRCAVPYSEVNRECKADRPRHPGVRSRPAGRATGSWPSTAPGSTTGPRSRG